MHTTYLLPLTVAALFVAVLSLGYRAGRRRGYGPFVVGSWAAVLMVMGKFALDLPPLMYGGIALLLAASVWNAWPKQTGKPEMIQLGMKGSHSVS